MFLELGFELKWDLSTEMRGGMQPGKRLLSVGFSLCYFNRSNRMSFQK